MNRTLFAFVLFASSVLCADSVEAQSAPADSLVGRVTDYNGKALRKVVVTSKSSGATVHTDKNGVFFFTPADLQDTLLVSPSKKRVAVVPVNGVNYLMIRLPENASGNPSVSAARDQIISMGIGMVRAEDRTTADIVITGDELRKYGTDLMRALIGKVPSLKLTVSAGGQSSVSMRGTTSFSGGNNTPLYVLDGVIVDTLDGLTTYDVKRVSIVKNASMYGSRGANGAIVVETR